MNLSKLAACSALLLYTAHTQAIDYKSATALVFETDPITKLNDPSLKSDTASVTFDPAYEKVNLPEVEFRDGQYYLSGPWVKIENWDDNSSAQLVDSDNDGDWTVKRGETGFNEVMAYYHLDKSQRYIQSLGFTGDDGILNKQIRVNSSAGDNFYHPFFDETAYSGPNKALSFLGSATGSAEIAQAEETDILLFEYMQAMIYDLHPNFGGGDQAAIAGGLGMYWGFSHNYAETQVASDELFQWGDYYLQSKTGIEGVSERQNKPELELKESLGSSYNRDYLYTEISGLVIESGPTLVASAHALALIEMAEAEGDEGRNAADKITLQALKNYQHSMTLPEWGQAVIKAATDLYPTKNYASIYQKQFTYKKFHVINPQFTVNNTLLPGDNVAFDLTLTNPSSVAIDNATLLTYIDRKPIYQDLGILAANASKQLNDDKLTVSIPADANCGDKEERSYQIFADSPVDEDGIFEIGNFTYWVGKEAITEFKAEPYATITEAELISKLTINNSDLTLDNFEFEIVIEHSDYSDLAISLLPPGQNKWIAIVDAEYGDGDIDYTRNIVLSATETVYIPRDNEYVLRYPLLAELKGMPMDGEWQLKVSDFDTSQFNGQLISWKLKQTTYTCAAEKAVVEVPLVPLVPAESVNLPPNVSQTAVHTSVHPPVLGGHTASYDASLASDPEGEPLTFLWEQVINEANPVPKLRNMEGSDTDTLTVTYPNVETTAVYTFQLTVSDGAESVTKGFSLWVDPNNVPVIGDIDKSVIQFLDETGEYLIEVSVTNKENESLGIDWALAPANNMVYRAEENRLYVKKSSLASGVNTFNVTVTATDEAALTAAKTFDVSLEGDTAIAEVAQPEETQDENSDALAVLVLVAYSA